MARKKTTTAAGVATMMQCHVEMQLIVREKFFVDAPRAPQQEGWRWEWGWAEEKKKDNARFSVNMTYYYRGFEAAAKVGVAVWQRGLRHASHVVQDEVALEMKWIIANGLRRKATRFPPFSDVLPQGTNMRIKYPTRTCEF